MRIGTLQMFRQSVNAMLDQQVQNIGCDVFGIRLDAPFEILREVESLADQSQKSIELVDI